MHTNDAPPETGIAIRRAVRQALQDLADPERAGPMRSYMKSAMPFYGVPAPPRRRACAKAFMATPPQDFGAWSDAVLLLWRWAEYREERYAALELLNWEPCRVHHVWDALPLVEELAVSGAWWDLVDPLHAPLGAILRAEPGRMRERMLEWAGSDDVWKRRCAIICQLGFKEELDFEFLTACIAPSQDSKDFFLRKGIGWALRDYAWTDPQRVKDYVDANEGTLSNLTRREALKNMDKLL